MFTVHVTTQLMSGSDPGSFDWLSLQALSERYHYRATGALQTTLTDGTELYQPPDLHFGVGVLGLGVLEYLLYKIELGVFRLRVQDMDQNLCSFISYIPPRSACIA